MAKKAKSVTTKRGPGRPDVSKNKVGGHGPGRPKGTGRGPWRPPRPAESGTIDAVIAYVRGLERDVVDLRAQLNMIARLAAGCAKARSFMAPIPTRESIFTDASRRMRAAFEDARNNVPHRGEAGGEGEVVVRRFLDEHLPARFRSTAGFVIDNDDAVSSHLDVILYDALNCPVYRTSERGMIVPNDAVAMVIEVKFALTTSELRSAIDKIHAIKRLKKTPLASTCLDHEQYETYGAVFAFESKVADDTVMDIWRDLLTPDNPLHKSCGLVVVLDRGIYSTVIQLPGMQPAPAIIDGISHCEIGTRIGVAYFPFGDRTLDHMLRLVLSQIAFFRHRVAHPGFRFDALGRVPTRWIAEYDSTQSIRYY